MYCLKSKYNPVLPRMLRIQETCGNVHGYDFSAVRNV